jgi:CRISPR-associated Csx2 family protein
MPRILITFLGTTAYKPCIFQMPDGAKSEVVWYVQEALTQLICADWTEDDQICVFLTKDAKVKNWDNGLEQQLYKAGLRCRIRPITGLHDGFSEAEIWENFQLLFDQIEVNASVWLDITNAFRSIPVFATVLLQYAKFLKNIQIEAVLYGAFEALGSASNIDARIPAPQDRIAPMLDLRNLVELQEWTQAAKDFIQHGNSLELARKATTDYPNLAHALEAVTLAFSLVRGKEIAHGVLFTRLKRELEQPIALAPFRPILEKVGEAVEAYQDNDLLNGFRAAQWCCDHQLYQQGVTIVRETIVSLICREMNLRDDDYKHGRRIIENAFNCYGRDRNDWKIPKDVSEETVESVINASSLPLYADVYQNLSHQYRNDINHGGFLYNAKPAADFKIALNRHLIALKSIIPF